MIRHEGPLGIGLGFFRNRGGGGVAPIVGAVLDLLTAVDVRNDIRSLWSYPGDGSFSDDLLLQPIAINETGIEGGRVVANLLKHSADLTQADWSITGSVTVDSATQYTPVDVNSYVHQTYTGVGTSFTAYALLSAISGTTTATVAIDDGVAAAVSTSVVVDTTPSWIRITRFVNFASTGVTVRLGGNGDAITFGGVFLVPSTAGVEYQVTTTSNQSGFDDEVFDSPYTNGVALGDSFTGANDEYDYAGSWLPALASDIRWAKMDDQGVGGEELVDMDAAFATKVTAQNPDSVVIQGGINDIRHNVATPVTAMKNAVISMIGKAAAASITPAVMNIAPFGNDALWTADRQSWLEEYNAWLLPYCAANSATHIDIHTPLGAGGDDLLALYDTGDGLHPNAIGNYVIANTFNSTIGGTPTKKSTPTQLNIGAAQTNACLGSRRFRVEEGWSLSTTNILNEVGVDGRVDFATTITDGSGASMLLSEYGLAVPNDSNFHTFRVLVKKTSGATVYPAIIMLLSNGTLTTDWQVIDTNNGVLVHATGAGRFDGSAVIKDRGEWWEITQILQNNSTGNTLLRCRVAPIAATTLDGATDNTATGSNVFDQADIFLGTNVAGPALETNGSSNSGLADVVTGLYTGITAAEGAIDLKFTPSGTGQTGVILGSYVDVDNYFSISTTPTTIIFRKRVAGVNYDAPFTYTHTINVEAQVQVYWDSTTGTSIRVSETDPTAETFITNANTASLPLSGSLEYGSLNATDILQTNIQNKDYPIEYDSKSTAGW